MDDKSKTEHGLPSIKEKPDNSNENEQHKEILAIHESKMEEVSGKKYVYECVQIWTASIPRRNLSGEKQTVRFNDYHG